MNVAYLHDRYISGRSYICTSPVATCIFYLVRRLDRGAWNERIGMLHNDVIKRKHFPRYWPFVQGIPRSPVNSPHKGQWRGALAFCLICARIIDWVNNREACDLGRHPTHYDITVISRLSSSFYFIDIDLQPHWSLWSRLFKIVAHIKPGSSFHWLSSVYSWWIYIRWY